MEDIDNRESDPDFEPQKKKQKKNHEIISNELMFYVINKFGREFFESNDRKDRKLMCEMISEDLVNEKSVVVDHDIIYNNLISQKSTFLREKKSKEKNEERKVNWPFYDVYLSLGDCIKSESSVSEKKHREKVHKKHSKSRKSSSNKEREKRSKDDSIKSADHTGTGLQNLFGESSGNSTAKESKEIDTIKHEAKSEDQNNLSTNDASISSINASSFQSTPKAENKKDSARPPPRKGYLFDRSVDVENRLSYYFGKYDKEEEEGADKVEQMKDMTQDEMVEYLDKLLKGSAGYAMTKDEEPCTKEDVPEDSVKTQIDQSNDSINATQATSSEDLSTQFYATQLPTTQYAAPSDDDDESNLEISGNVLEESNDMMTQNDSMADNSFDTRNTTEPMKPNDENGQEKMAVDEDKSPIDANNNADPKPLEQTSKNVSNEDFDVVASQKLEKTNGTGENSNRLKQLNDIFKQKSLLMTEMMQIDEKRLKLQSDIIKLDLEYNAMLAEILDNK